MGNGCYHLFLACRIYSFWSWFTTRGNGGYHSWGTKACCTRFESLSHWHFKIRTTNSSLQSTGQTFPTRRKSSYNTVWRLILPNVLVLMSVYSTRCALFLLLECVIILTTNSGYTIRHHTMCPILPTRQLVLQIFFPMSRRRSTPRSSVRLKDNAMPRNNDTNSRFREESSV